MSMRHTFLKVMTVCFVLSLLLIACGKAPADSNANDSQATETEDPIDEEVSPKQHYLTVGETARFGGFEVTLDGLRVEEAGSLDQPDNDQFLVATFSVDNDTEEVQDISSILSVDLYDEPEEPFKQALLIDGIDHELDGLLDPGESMTGEVAFDVDIAEVYYVSYRNPLKSDKGVWKVPEAKLR